MANGTAIVPAPPVISRLPWGLLDLHGLRNGGQYPRNIEENIRVTLDELGLMLASNREYQASTPTAPAAPGTSTLFTVPASEVWYIDSVGQTVVTGVGEAINGYLAVAAPGAVAAVPMSATFQQGASLTLTYKADRAIWAGAGESILSVNHLVTGTVDLFAWIRFLRFRY